MLQSFSGVVFLISITIPGYASAAQVASVTANVVWASTATTAQINAAIADTLAQLALVGATSPQAVGVIVAVNGEACTGQACSALISPSSSASTVNVGAIIGGVIGGVAALVIFVGLVIACRMGAFGDRRATGSGYAASAYDTAPGGGVGGGRALPAYVMNAAAYKPSSARSF